MVTPVRIAYEPGVNISNEYASVDSFPLGNRHLLLQQDDGFNRLHSGDGTYLRTLPSSVNARSSPRWDEANPDTFTFVQGRSLFSFNVATGSATLLREFTEYIKYTADEQNGVDDRGEANARGNHRVFAGIKPDGSTEVFVFDLTNGLKSATMPVSAFDGLKLSHDDRIILSQPAGIFVNDDMAWRRIYPYNSHACPCVYKGTPSLAVVGDKNIILVDLNTAKQTVVPFIVDSSFVVAHVSACDKPFLILSTSGKNMPSQIVRISLEDLSAEVLCETRTVYRNYASQPKASLSRDGRMVVFSADDGKQISAWMLTMAAAQPVPVPQPQPVVVAVYDLATHRIVTEKQTATVYRVAA